MYSTKLILYQNQRNLDIIEIKNIIILNQL